MERILFMLFAVPVLSIAITVSSNGNSPNIKMEGGMMVDIQKGFVPMTTKSENNNPIKTNYDKSKKYNLNSTKLSINERYRRLIPYMTFYYANDIASPTTEAFGAKEVEVEKVQLVEEHHLPDRTAKKLVHSYHNIPRYQGNRLTKYNIASASSGKVYGGSNTGLPLVPTNYNTPVYDNNHLLGQYNGRYNLKQNIRSEIAFPNQSRRPQLNLFHTEDDPNIRYYLSNKEPTQKYKLVPYEQTPPVKYIPNNSNIYANYNKQTSVPILVRKEPVHIKPRPIRPLDDYDNVYIPQQVGRKQPTTISENYYEKVQTGYNLKAPVIEGGFKPIIAEEVTHTTAAPVYVPAVEEPTQTYYENEKQQIPYIDTRVAHDNVNRVVSPTYYQYMVDQPVRQPEYVSNSISLESLLHSLQKTKTIPNPITRENVGPSIKTLLQVLNALRVAPLQNDVEAPVLSTPKPFVVTPKIAETPSKPVVEPVSELNDEVEFSHEPYLAPVNTPSQHLDDFSFSGGSTQTFPLPVTSDDEGGTPGRAGVDYPILTTIPQTSFDCKTQRYKGFFADPETKCQVWHYCDLNGGQASFLCPNGTIFSQAGLTCDWWFNVRCASTTQLYVLNESLYKYILPHSPKFPEDYSGPLVDKYLTLKFKEMEEQFKKNKNKQSASDKMDSEENSNSEEAIVTTEISDTDSDSNEKRFVTEPSIIIENVGVSGNVERLQA